MSDAENAAISALREAVRAVSIGETAAADAVPDRDREPDAARETGSLLEAVARLLRSTDLDAVPGSGSNHGLHAIVQHLDAGAELARRVADRGSSTDDTDDTDDTETDAVAELGRVGGTPGSSADHSGPGPSEPSMPEKRRVLGP